MDVFGFLACDIYMDYIYIWCEMWGMLKTNIDLRGLGSPQGLGF